MLYARAVCVPSLLQVGLPVCLARKGARLQGACSNACTCCSSCTLPLWHTCAMCLLHRQATAIPCACGAGRPLLYQQLSANLFLLRGTLPGAMWVAGMHGLTVASVALVV
jgi:hypothetical protein